ncbi:PREDICTED: myb-like protein I [Drosophila arizonae]|uniref:Myb-like protein I n=1 Tax=Drosophila arizonae TaxID=7263 RepID=A0ABM1PDQ0_DROAR|nr:PREDICTED: myb-like protein I [Drosophila arizonae]
MANNNINNMANINNNIASRLGSRIGTNSNTMQQSNNGLFGNGMNQVNRNQHGCSIASDSLRLADLMNLDANSCVNLNVAEVARNAMILLSTIVHKPMLDVDVQQQLSNLQNKNIGLDNEPDGVDMNIRPQATELRMYHRFK